MYSTSELNRIVDLMDFFKTDEIDINLFFEIFRITSGPIEVNLSPSYFRLGCSKFF